MAHYKRRRRRRGGIKGCCGMCMLRTTDGRRSGRLLTPQEQLHWLTLQEELALGAGRPHRLRKK
jgi:hypothetical protein